MRMRWRTTTMATTTTTTTMIANKSFRIFNIAKMAAKKLQCAMLMDNTGSEFILWFRVARSIAVLLWMGC